MTKHTNTNKLVVINGNKFCLFLLIIWQIKLLLDCLPSIVCFRNECIITIFKNEKLNQHVWPDCPPHSLLSAFSRTWRKIGEEQDTLGEIKYNCSFVVGSTLSHAYLSFILKGHTANRRSKISQLSWISLIRLFSWMECFGVGWFVGLFVVVTKLK